MHASARFAFAALASCLIAACGKQAPPQDQFFGDDYHSGGAYQLSYGFAWMSSNARRVKV